MSCNETKDVDVSLFDRNRGEGAGWGQSLFVYGGKRPEETPLNPSTSLPQSREARTEDFHELSGSSSTKRARFSSFVS